MTEHATYKQLLKVRDEIWHRLHEQRLELSELHILVQSLNSEPATMKVRTDQRVRNLEQVVKDLTERVRILEQVTASDFLDRHGDLRITDIEHGRNLGWADVTHCPFMV